MAALAGYHAVVLPLPNVQLLKMDCTLTHTDLK